MGDPDRLQQVVWNLLVNAVQSLPNGYDQDFVAKNADGTYISRSAKIVPISGFPGTGNKLGAGAAVESQLTISGTEYGGFPPPLIGVGLIPGPNPSAR